MSRLHLITLLAAILLAGCHDPYSATSAPRPTPTSLPSGELVGKIPRAERDALAQPLARPAASADEALRRFAALTTNWTGSTVSQQYTQAARAAIGQARRDAQQAAATMRSDPELDGTASRSSVAGIVSQSDGWTLVITHEQLSPDVGEVRYRVYRAHTRSVRGGYAVDQWEPQP